MKKSLSNQNSRVYNEKWEMILAHLGLAKSIARKFCRYYDCMDIYDDSVSEAYKALIDAVRNFKAENGTTLACYAYPWIQKAILKYIKKEKRHGIHVSRSFLLLVSKASVLVERLFEQRQTLSLHAIADYLGASLEEAEKALSFLALSFTDVDTIHPSQEESLSLKKQQNTPQDSLCQNFGILDDKIQELRPEWRTMMIKRYIESKSFTQIAAEMNQKNTTIKVWHKRALDSLRCL